MQSSLADTAALALAWQIHPETAPFEGLALHIVPAPAPCDPFRHRVVCELAVRLGAVLTPSRGCAVCVLCRYVAEAAPARRGKSTEAEAVAPRPRCKAGAVFVTDAWVVEAVRSASRPAFEGFLA